MIRQAKFADIVEIIELLEKAAERSKFAGMGGIDRAAAKDDLRTLISMQGGKGMSGSLCNIAQRGDSIVGFHIGVKQPIQRIGVKWEATDVYFYVRQQEGPFLGPALLGEFLKWAAADARVLRILPGVTDIMGDWRATASMYEKIGFQQCGVILERMAVRSKA